ncbi:uncharacterized protein CTRU02_206435 [Colletotrichum truncatum]|uniref:Uncharacterized protein n=1 Tax=Colletotrichum truncatum TaxID=5467 RepID=A0ACC3Z752_COLTU|nr:uncharacterized protein CTRU02_15242 [Colletotrichum truncatum]KAF6781289.1 hypothetical protein CTRU02_15242 [Colletotrichum truncatum]
MAKFSIVLLLAASSLAFGSPAAVQPEARQAAGCQPDYTVCREGWAWCCYSSSSCYEFAPPMPC